VAGFPNNLFITLGTLITIFSNSFYYYTFATTTLTITGKLRQRQESFVFKKVFVHWGGGLVARAFVS
jgi:hypothetical protein